MFSQLNDNEFVSEIERKFPSRKKTAGFLLIFALAGIGATLYFAYHIGHMLLSIADNLSYIGAASSDGVLREQAKKTSAEFLLIQGASLGFLLGGLAAASMHSLMHALYLLFDSRKERLLIEYSKRLKGIR